MTVQEGQYVTRSVAGADEPRPDQPLPLVGADEADTLPVSDVLLQLRLQIDWVSHRDRWSRLHSLPLSSLMHYPLLSPSCTTLTLSHYPRSCTTLSLTLMYYPLSHAHALPAHALPFSLAHALPFSPKKILKSGKASFMLCLTSVTKVIYEDDLPQEDSGCALQNTVDGPEQGGPGLVVERYDH